MRFPLVVCVFVCFAVMTIPSFGQSPNGNINGLVADPTNAAVADADIVAVNDVTGVQYTSKTNNEGIYALLNLPPGPYRVQVSKIGFKTLIKPDIVLNVQDSLSINFTLLIGAVHEIVTVAGGAPIVNTESAAVSTVVDREYVENIPLNGRSFQDLITLTPGVVTATPQNTANQVVGSSGEFSVNGQRTDSNYYSVDGVSANIGTYPVGFHISTGGALPVSTALGTTQGLVSIDALEEFRIQGSTYSAEYGRNPGGQFSFVTRSGTNQWHGSVFDYLRNDVFDANDWFNDYFQQPRSALRQNDFGGTLGGPLRITNLKKEKYQTFFFFSYEGLRLVQPQESSISYVPTVQLRQSAPTALAPVLNAFPRPYCPAAATGCTLDLGNGLGDFIGSWSNPSSINAYSIRLDQSLHGSFKVFFRFSDTPSEADTRSTPGSIVAASQTGSSTFHSRTYTLGLTTAITPALGNEFRLNYSSNQGGATTRIDDFGGATAVSLAELQGIDMKAPSSAVAVGIFLPGYSSFISQTAIASLQRQWNLTDNIDVLLGRHQFKFGLDYRRLSPINRYYNPGASYYFYAASSIQANSPDFAEGDANGVAYPLYQNFSAFAQDEWRIAQRLTLSMGLRWEVNPAPGSTRGPLPYTIEGSSLSTLSLAPQGTPIWRTTWYNFAPRLGVAYVLHNSPGFETVVRTGGGLFFDTGQQYGSQGYSGPGFSASNYSGSSLGVPVSFPVPLAQLIPPLVNPPVPPYANVFAFPAHKQLPYAIQWNAAVQQGLGKTQALTISYVGSHGGRLLGLKEINVQPFNPNFSALFLYSNALTSDYDALQFQFQKKVTQGLHALSSYTWSHCLDYGSENAALPYERGNCDFDVRHNFSAALSYDIPDTLGESRVGSILFHHWGIDDRFTARTAFPVTLSGPDYTDPATGQIVYAGLDRVLGEPTYLYGSQYPGGRTVNADAFALPPGCDFFSCPSPSVGNAARNFVRGFGAWQMDVAVRRNFPIHEGLRLQFRAEAFNVFNHPNFGSINATFGNPLFGQATATLGSSLGVLSPLYQIGGPRSLQFALKLMF